MTLHNLRILSVQLWNLLLRRIRRQLHFTLLVGFIALLIYACAGNTPPNQMDSTTSRKPLPTAERVVKHALGEIAVPANPQRVVVLDIPPLDTALALGVKPVGSIVRGSENFPTYLASQTAGITLIGQDDQPNLEKILLLKPDLILGDVVEHHRLYDKLSSIAPTFLAEGNRVKGEWKAFLRSFGMALGRTAEAEQLLSNYNQRVATLKQKLGKQAANTSMSLVMTVQGRISYMTRGSFPGTVLADVGLARPSAQDKQDKFLEQVSQEKLDSIDGDMIFLLRFPSKSLGSLTLAQFKTEPLFAQLKAVKQGQVYEVNSEVWAIGTSIQAANGILDDLFKYLVGNSAAGDLPKT